MLNARTVQLATDAPMYHPAKTPARSTKNRRENIHQGSMTVQNGKARNVNLLRTPFQPTSAQPGRLLNDVQSHTGKAPPIQLVVTHQPKPLADKTPFVNRVLDNYKTPGPANQPLKPLKLAPTLEAPPNTNPTPGSTRASSTRKHARVPKPQAHHDFQTPANIGNHWDISEDDIVVPEEMDGTEKEIEEEPLDFNDEIEYMAPNTLSLEYQPPFDFELPDYKLLGQDILHNLYSYPEEQAAPSPPSFEFTFTDEELMKWDDLSLPSLSPSDDDGEPSATRDTHHNLKQSQMTRVKQPPSSVAAKKATASNRSVSVMTLRSKTTTLASTRSSRPASSMSSKPPPSSAISTTKPKTRSSVIPAPRITTTSASSRTVRKPTTTYGSSTKTKPAQTATALAATKVTTSTKRGLQSASSIPRPSSTVKSIRPASASGVGDTTTATRRATIKRPSTSASVTRPKPQSLTTTATTRSSSSTSVQRAKLSKATAITPTTTLGNKAEKKPSTGAATSKMMTRAKTISMSTMKGRTLRSDTAVKKGSSSSITSPSQVPAGVDVVSFERVEIKLEEDKDDDGDNVDGDDDGEEEEEETIRLVVQIKKLEAQGDADNMTRREESTKQPPRSENSIVNPTAESIISQGEQIAVERGGRGGGRAEEESDLSTVEEITEVSMAVDIIEKMEVLKLE